MHKHVYRGDCLRTLLLVDTKLAKAAVFLTDHRWFGVVPVSKKKSCYFFSGVVNFAPIHAFTSMNYFYLNFFIFIIKLFSGAVSVSTLPPFLSRSTGGWVVLYFRAVSITVCLSILDRCVSQPWRKERYSSSGYCGTASYCTYYEHPPTVCSSFQLGIRILSKTCFLISQPVGF